MYARRPHASPRAPPVWHPQSAIASIRDDLSLAPRRAPQLTKQIASVKAAFDAQRAMLVVVSKSKKPSQAEMMDVIKATSEEIGNVQSTATTDRRDPTYNHRQAMKEAIPALGWVMIEKTPVPHVNEMWDCGAFNQQKILVEFKGKDEAQACHRTTPHDTARHCTTLHDIARHWTIASRLLSHVASHVYLQRCRVSCADHVCQGDERGFRGPGCLCQGVPSHWP
jgi:hypothetical protein